MTRFEFDVATISLGYGRLEHFWLDTTDFILLHPIFELEIVFKRVLRGQGEV